MRQFLKYVGATLVGLMLFFTVGFLFLLALAFAASSSDKDTVVAKDSVLELKLDRPLAERGRGHTSPSTRSLPSE